MNLENTLEKCGGGRLRVVREYGESEHLVSGRWVHRWDVLGEYVPARVRLHRDTCQRYELYQHGPATLAAILPPKLGRALARRHPFMVLHIEADDCAVLLVPMERMNMTLAREMKLRYRRTPKPMTPEHKAKLIDAGRAALSRHREQLTVNAKQGQIVFSGPDVNIRPGGSSNEKE
jgi:hypothetical protein